MRPLSGTRKRRERCFELELRKVVRLNREDLQVPALAEGLLSSTLSLEVIIIPPISLGSLQESQLWGRGDWPGD